MKNFILLIFFTALFCQVTAQNAYITYSRSDVDDRIEDCNGGSGILILSKSNDLVINVPNVPDVKVKYNGERVDGYYEYIVLLPEKSTNTPKIQASRRGVVYKVDFTARTKPDFLIAYKLFEVPHPIRLEEQSKGNEVHLNGEEAVVEFTTLIKDLNVVCDSSLNVKVKRETSKVDKNVTIITLTFPIASINHFKGLLNKISALKNENAKLFEFLSDSRNSSQASDDMWQKLDSLEQEIPKLEKAYRSLTDLRISIPGSNQLSVDISSLGPRSRRCYVVVPLVIEKNVFVTECSSYMSQGAKLFSLRKYADARKAYVNALSARDVVSDMRSTIQTCISQCDSCIEYDKWVRAGGNRIKELKKSGPTTQEKVAECASAVKEYAEIIYNYNPDPHYLKVIGKMDSLTKKLPLKIKFTIVEWKTLEEGEKISNVEIWTYKGDHSSLQGALSSNKKFKKFFQHEFADFKQVAITDGSGVAEIQLNRESLPVGLLFIPKNRKDLKLMYRDMNDLFYHAKGTYVEKQIRLRLYTKID